ncbi:hypothetical protein SLE2022_073110 [Rubroshorea leprosula]
MKFPKAQKAETMLPLTATSFQTPNIHHNPSSFIPIKLLSCPKSPLTAEAYFIHISKKSQANPMPNFGMIEGHFGHLTAALYTKVGIPHIDHARHVMGL